MGPLVTHGHMMVPPDCGPLEAIMWALHGALLMISPVVFLWEPFIASANFSVRTDFLKLSSAQPF